MGRFFNGMLVGLGISLLIAPRPGKELRQQLIQSWRDIRSLPATSAQEKPSAQKREEHIPSAQEVVQRAAQKGATVPETAQRTTRQTGPDLQPPRSAS